jgi:hypothetical protein
MSLGSFLQMKNYRDYMSSNSKRYIELCAGNNYIRKEHNLQDVESIKASGARNVSLGDCLLERVAIRFQGEADKVVWHGTFE